MCVSEFKKTNKKKTDNIEYIPGRYKVTNTDNIIQYFNSMYFEMSKDELLLLSNEYEMNEYGYLFINSNWVKTCIPNSIWVTNSKLIDKYFVKWHVEKVSLCYGIYNYVECLFTKYNTSKDINNTVYIRNIKRLRNYKNKYSLKK